MKRIQVGAKRHSEEMDCWVFFTMKLPSSFASDSLDDVVKGLIHSTQLNLGAGAISDPSELTDELFEKHGVDAVGLLNSVASTTAGYPTVAIVSDRFAKWLEDGGRTGTLKFPNEVPQRVAAHVVSTLFPS